jgi:serine/threonine protein kinase
MIEKNTLEIKLIDFGSTTPFTNHSTTVFYGTQKFSAPEALNGSSYIPLDQEVWGLGTLLYVLLFKMDPFSSDDEILDLEISKRISRIRTTVFGKDHPPIIVSDAAADACIRMLAKDPDDRPSIQEILDMPFFKRRGD